MENVEKNKPNSRRGFLLASSAIVGGLVSLAVYKPFKALAEAKATGGPIGKASIPGKTVDLWYGFIFDIDKCIGCGSCVQACKKENNVRPEPFFFRTWVEQYAEKLDGTLKVESPNGGIDGQKQSVPDNEISNSFFVPKTCNHCFKSPCTQVCPVGATFVSPEGVVLVDDKYCIGCGYCVQACPYGCRYIDPDKDVADKCTFCYHRINKGLSTACVEVCPTGARTQGNLHDKKGPLVKFLKEHNCRVLKPHLNTGAKLFYNSLREEVR